MDLALHLGMTADGLERAMTEREFEDWGRYVARRMLPWRRMELHLAQLALVAASAAGVKNAKISDYLFDPVDEPFADAANDDEITAEDVAAQFGATVYRKGKR